MSGLKNKVAVITGATSGIGMLLSKQLLEEGMQLILTGRNDKVLGKELNSADKKGNWTFYRADLALQSDLKRFIDNVNKSTQQIDVLINCAGIIQIGPLETTDVKHLDDQYMVNVRAPYFITQQLLPGLKISKGTVVFVNSTAGLNSWKNISQYAASKHALTAIAKSLREEVAKDGIRVINIFPGATDTPMQQHIQKLEGNDYKAEKFMSPELVSSAIVHAIKQPHTAVLTDIVIKPFPG